MRKEKENLIALFEKVNAGLASTAEKEKLAKWLSTMDVASENPDFALIEAQRLKYFPDDTGSDDTRNRGKKIARSRIFRYAAVWLAIVGSCAIILWQWRAHTPSKEPAMVTINNPRGTHTKSILPDSSEVHLAAGSSIGYLEDFAGKTRTVTLHGEAFFSISKNSKKPFIIHTDSITTSVLGTSFRVTAIRGRPIEVAVASGKVAVAHGADALATLTAGRRVVWHSEKREAEMGDVNIHALESWKNGEMVFEKLEMVHIAHVLRNRYGVDIQFADDKIGKNRVSGAFDALKTIEQVMLPLSMAGKFTYEITPTGTFIIYGVDGKDM